MSAQPSIPSRNTARVPELDGLRGIAILLIVILHYLVKWVRVSPGTPTAWLMEGLKLTWTGVDLFFVLSGFLIGGILLENQRAQNYFKVFYVRRICRIFPLYFAWVLLFIGLLRTASSTFFQAPFSWLFDKPLVDWSYLTFTQNLEMAHRGEFGSNWMAVTWSLAVEEQFYLVLPFLIRFVSPRFLSPVLVGLIALAPLLRCTVVNGFTSYLLMPCRADALLMGVLAAVMLRSSSMRQWIEGSRGRLYLGLGGLGLGMVFLACKAASPTSPMMKSLGLTWVAAFYTILLLIAVTERRGAVSALVRFALLRQLGLIAFGVYLLHQAVNGLAHAWLRGTLPVIGDGLGLLVTLGSFGITLFLAWLSWTYFEKRFVSFGHAWKYLHDRSEVKPAATDLAAVWAKQANP